MEPSEFPFPQPDADGNATSDPLTNETFHHFNPASGIRHPASGIRHPASGIRHPASGIRHPASGDCCLKFPGSSKEPPPARHGGRRIGSALALLSLPACCGAVPPAPNLGRRSRWTLLAALSLLAGAALLPPAPARAQTSITLISNTGQTDNSRYLSRIQRRCASVHDRQQLDRVQADLGEGEIGYRCGKQHGQF